MTFDEFLSGVVTDCVEARWVEAPLLECVSCGVRFEPYREEGRYPVCWDCENPT